MNQARILVVDDDKEIARAIEKLLSLEEYEVIKAFDGLEALDVLVADQVDLIIMDIMMPKLDGLSTVMKVREKKNIPIILLSAKTEESDKVLGLSMGADDYVTKPFNPNELVARVKSQLRRYIFLGDKDKSISSTQFEVGGLFLDTKRKQLLVDGVETKLTATEYKILELLITNAGIVFSAENIYRKVWNEDAFSAENTVMVHIRRIREKIEVNPKEPKYLKVVWGIGYKIEKNK